MLLKRIRNGFIIPINKNSTLLHETELAGNHPATWFLTRYARARR